MGIQIFNNKILRYNGKYLQHNPAEAGGSFVAATGGTITYDGDYKIHTFTTTANFIVTSPGDVSIFAIAAGGPGYNNAKPGQGGGGGACSGGNVSITNGTHACTVGTSGQNSVVGNNLIVAITASGRTGGAAASCTGDWAYSGGDGYPAQNYQAGGAGGGGAGTTQAGGNATATVGGSGGSLYGGNGGNGITGSIENGKGGYVYGGGGGGCYSTGAPGGGAQGIIQIKYKYQ